ncbi:hypothetical protein FNJ61_04565 [Bacteroides pyogenes]|nr:hypothetical protein FNJ61_04565 [Bacteroides pyogenes]
MGKIAVLADGNISFSSCKSVTHNVYMLERVMCVYRLGLLRQVIDSLFNELILFTAESLRIGCFLNEPLI